jgi:Tol biopolymer transport system component
VTGGTAWNACNVYLMNVDGSNRKLIADTGLTANTPSWSPDGKQILFNRIQKGVTSIYAVGLDGSDMTLVVNNARDADWSQTLKPCMACATKLGYLSDDREEAHPAHQNL